MRTLKALVILFTAGVFLPQAFALEKPYHELQVSTVDLKSYPENVQPQAPDVEITIGDLHGNAIKLLYFLIRSDVLAMDAKDYQSLVQIYEKTPEQLSKKDLGLFQSIINLAAVSRQHKIRFLGDDLCDRGMNDFYTLTIFKKLDLAKVPFEIVLSNHGNFFLSAFEREEQSFLYNPYGQGRLEDLVRSMLNMGKLIDKGLIEQNDVVDMIEQHYLKHLIFPGYTYNKQRDELTLYSHAPIDIKLLKALAVDLNQEFHDEDSTELMKSMDAINAQIKTWIEEKSFTRHYKALNRAHQDNNTESPIKQVLWNRNYSILDRTDTADGKAYTLNYVHGHDSMPNVVDLDNLLGKGDLRQGPYAIYLTHP